MAETTRLGRLAGGWLADFATSVIAPHVAHTTQALTELGAATPKGSKTA
jgi:hypothetical protein